MNPVSDLRLGLPIRIARIQRRAHVRQHQRRVEIFLVEHIVMHVLGEVAPGAEILQIRIGIFRSERTRSALLDVQPGGGIGAEIARQRGLITDERHHAQGERLDEKLRDIGSGPIIVVNPARNIFCGVTLPPVVGPAIRRSQARTIPCTPPRCWSPTPTARTAHRASVPASRFRSSAPQNREWTAYQTAESSSARGRRSRGRTRVPPADRPAAMVPPITRLSKSARLPLRIAAW